MRAVSNCIVRSAWEHAIGDERGLVRLQAHVIELHNITQVSARPCRCVSPDWLDWCERLTAAPKSQLLLILLSAQVCL